jgi:NhaC family Na+:H+ antiporter
MAGVLGVATVAYLPFCFFNLLSPVISLIYGFTGFRIEHIPVDTTGGTPAPGVPETSASAAPEGVPA